MNKHKYDLSSDNTLNASFSAELGGLTIIKFLESNSFDLAIRQNKSVNEIEAVKSKICDACGITRDHSLSSTIMPTVMGSPLFIPSFKHMKVMPPLDLVLTNVIVTQHITEIAGESGTGKTRIILYIISVILLTTEHSIALIVTSVEDVLNLLVEFLTHLSPLLTNHAQVNATVLLKRLYFLREPSPSGLLRLFEPTGQVWELCRQCPTLKLICVDSIGYLRILYNRPGSSNNSQSTNPGYDIGQALLSIARLKNIAVILTNHVGDYIPTSQLASSAQQHSKRSQFPGQSIPGLLPRLPVNSLSSDNQLHVYTYAYANDSSGSNEDVSQILIQGDVDDSRTGLLSESMVAPSTSLLFPQAAYIMYKSDRTFSRDVVMSSNKLVTPSLGISWGSHISTRIVLALTQKETILHLLWSEFLPACSLITPCMPEKFARYCS